jgi:hypothetical protein
MDPEISEYDRVELRSRREQDAAFCRALIRAMMLGHERVTQQATSPPGGTRGDAPSPTAARG